VYGLFASVVAVGTTFPTGRLPNKSMVDVAALGIHLDVNNYKPYKTLKESSLRRGMAGMNFG
jgi:hypothetical protein